MKMAKEISKHIETEQEQNAIKFVKDEKENKEDKQKKNKIINNSKSSIKVRDKKNGEESKENEKKRIK